MALNGKYVKIGTIIDGVYRDFGWTHEVNWIDAVEWIGECLDLIAAPKQYVEKVTDGNEDINHPCPIVVKNYRGTLPSDFLYPIQIKESSTNIPLRYSGDSFHRGLEIYEADMNVSTTSNIGDFSSPLQASKNTLLKDACAGDLTYQINDCYIFTNFEEGELIASYKAFPTDQDGFPLIPDNQAYKQALKYYIAEKIAQKMFIQGKMDMGRFNYIQRERDWYVGKANSAAHLPTMDQMETWKNEFVRLIPNINHHSDGFRQLGNQQRQTNHNSI
jgi:hypothetical protein